MLFLAGERKSIILRGKNKTKLNPELGKLTTLIPPYKAQQERKRKRKARREGEEKRDMERGCEGGKKHPDL